MLFISYTDQNPHKSLDPEKDNFLSWLYCTKVLDSYAGIHWVFSSSCYGLWPLYGHLIFSPLSSSCELWVLCSAGGWPLDQWKFSPNRVDSHIFSLPFCGSNLINQFCDIPSVFKLMCGRHICYDVTHGSISVDFWLLWQNHLYNPWVVISHRSGQSLWLSRWC